MIFKQKSKKKHSLDFYVLYRKSDQNKQECNNFSIVSNMIKNSCLTELIEAKTIEEILSKTEGARKEAKELNDKSLIILLYNLSYYKFFERTKDKEIEIFQLQKQIKEQYTQKTLVLNATTQIDTNMKEKDKSMNNIVNKDTQYITDTVNNNLILDPHSDIETIKDIFNSISNTKISSHTKQMLQIIFNSYSNLKKENESLKQKLNQIEKEENE